MDRDTDHIYICPTRIRGLDVENVLFEHEGEEDGEPPENGEHGKRESLRRSQAEDQIAHVEQRKGKHLDRHGKVPGEINRACEKMNPDT